MGTQQISAAVVRSAALRTGSFCELCMQVSRVGQLVSVLVESDPWEGHGHKGQPQMAGGAARHASALWKAAEYLLI